MAEYNFHAMLRAMIEEEIGAITDGLATGSCTDIAEYRDRCGQIAGLNIALTYADAVKKKLFGDDR